jgi:hypothetical protein
MYSNFWSVGCRHLSVDLEQFRNVPNKTLKVVYKKIDKLQNVCLIYCGLVMEVFYIQLLFWLRAMR